MVIDAHVHVWDADLVTYPWLHEVPSLAPRYVLTDVLPAFDAAGVSGCVLVQAADDEADTELMMAAASAHPGRVLGVVGWVPLTDPVRAEELLDRWSARPLVGVRHLIHRDPDPRLLLRPEVDETLQVLAERGLAFDACAESLELLELVPGLAAKHPGLRIVVDHLAKPPIRHGGWQPWAGLLAEAASVPNVSAKLSGLNTAAASSWTSADFTAYVDHALEVFGPDRILYGGDWPFALLAADSYAQIWHGIHECLADLGEAERQAVLHDNAIATYGLDDGRRTVLRGRDGGHARAGGQVDDIQTGHMQRGGEVTTGAAPQVTEDAVVADRPELAGFDGTAPRSHRAGPRSIGSDK